MAVELKTIVGTSYNRETGTYKPTEFRAGIVRCREGNLFVITDGARKWSVLLSDVKSFLRG